MTPLIFSLSTMIIVALLALKVPLCFFLIAYIPVTLFLVLTYVYIGKSQKKFEVLKKKFSHPKINMTWDTVDFHKVSKYIEPSELIYYNSNNHKAVRFNMANIENVKPLILDIFEEK